MEIIKNIGLGLGLILGSMSIMLGTTACVCYLARWVIGPGYEAAGPVAVVVIGAAWLVGAVWRNNYF